MSIGATEQENLTLWRQAVADNHELCLLTLYELGRSAGKAWKSDTLQDIKALRVPSMDTTSEEALLPVGELCRVASIQEQLAFCRGFLSLCPDFPHEEEASGLLPPPAAPRVVFWDNYFGREALRRFRTVLPLPRPITAPSLTAVCEELAGGRADFALLPLGDSREGKMHRLLEEIDRFELRIAYTCDIPYPDEGRSICVALLTRLYASPATKVHAEKLLACSFLEEGDTLCEILSAASGAGLTLKQIDSRPAAYGEDGIYYHPVFRVEGDGRLFETYLTICHPRARVTGKYWHLKAKET